MKLMARSPKATDDNNPEIIASLSRPRYTRADLLAGSDDFEPRSEEDRAWIDAPSVGRERL